MLSIFRILMDQQVQSRALSTLKRTRPNIADAYRQTPKVKQFTGSLAKIGGGAPAKVLNQDESAERVQIHRAQANVNMPPKKIIPVGPGRLPITRRLPSYPR